MPRSPFLDLPGAVAADAPDAGVAAHYGEPLAEQRRLEAGRAIVDLSHRAVLSVTGPDRLTWTDSLSSQSLTGLGAGESSETLLLSVKGRLEHAVRVVDDGGTLWMIVEAAQAESLAAWLESMKFLLRVEVADRTDDVAVVGAVGEFAPERPVAPAWRDPWDHVGPGGHQYARGEHPGTEWRWTEHLVERASLAALADRVRAGSLAVAGVLALEALRIAAWRPRFATEVDERTIPHELDWLRSAVHLNKGCYRGQETVAKAHNLGHPPRRLVMLHLDGSLGVLPRAGTEVVAVGDDGEGVVVGRITSAALHHELGPVALAVVKRTASTEATFEVRVDEARVAAAQEVVVPPDAGASADVPRMPRVGARRR